MAKSLGWGNGCSDPAGNLLNEVDPYRVRSPRYDSAMERQAETTEADVIAFRPRVSAERPKVRHAIGDVLRDERVGQGRTLADVADDAAVSLPYLSEIERGRKEVSSDLLESVCDALMIEVPTVLERAADRLRANGLHLSGPQLLAA